MTNQPLSSNRSRVDLEYRRKTNAEEMRYQIVSFTLMIFLTLLAFAAVAIKGFTSWFTIPFIVLLAAVQVVFQLYYFMHMSHKGHEAPSMFLFTGLFMGLIIVLAFMTIIWW
ncbi:cytochrome c oxidase subunit IVB [Neobacillus sp. OS1-32]|jgi:cytochrome c oxidase subunit 4|uniref:Cytochrome c oxidase subunit IVB n=1 Tax=Neobacillus paridis TaxID=2803862 RepID=A0ABS1TMP3_9BACI|nr:MULTISPECIES: cytochrome c oxidase subunit IVB [Neobacillus]MBL4952552.1 cytochrome c oxidase subunit IVB [Neobacillus paridis]WML31930.1 cytochrome c oxidase subunit IVB [Neobacillus sp. OS1-32]